MRYFLLKNDPKYNTSPVIENWYPKIDVRLIRKETGHKLPKRELLFIQSNPDTIFTDIIDFPFFLGTKMVRDVIKMYEPTTQFKEIILLDRKNATSEIYYIPLLEHCDCLAPESELSRGRDTLITAVLDPEKIEDRSIFYLGGFSKLYAVARLDLVESLLRRGGRGIGLERCIIANPYQHISVS